MMSITRKLTFKALNLVTRGFSVSEVLESVKSAQSMILVLFLGFKIGDPEASDIWKKFNVKYKTNNCEPCKSTLIHFITQFIGKLTTESIFYFDNQFKYNYSSSKIDK